MVHKNLNVLPYMSDFLNYNWMKLPFGLQE